MQIPLKIAFEGGLTSSDALVTRIEREAEKLEQFSDRITACRVSVVGRSGRHRQGDLYGVRIFIALPGRKEVAVTRNPPADHAHEDPYVAIRDAFSAARRRLQDRRQRTIGEVKEHSAPPHGRIDRLMSEDGYGFIETSDGREVYFHRNAVVNGGFDRMKEGAEVWFTEAEGDKGAQASTVHLVKGSRHIVEPA
jgi:cold shock CspA family protein/ribosome-associated translation inhibitor RaiA